ncbi:MAG: YbaK/EbsC family protein [candidate division Zixibacteria bacterium]|nr:YbaK/EbsC family protein [candidate division Zixibacteria bacterium]
MPVNRLREYLEKTHVPYVTKRHTPSFTAQETAHVANIPEQEMVKTVMIKVDGELAMAVLPARYRVDFSQLRRHLGARTVELAGEHEFSEMFPACETGAMPPFGNLWGMKVYVAEALTDDREIAFNGGSHTELVKMSFADYQMLVKPTIVRFSSRRVW